MIAAPSRQLPALLRISLRIIRLLRHNPGASIATHAPTRLEETDVVIFAGLRLRVTLVARERCQDRILHAVA